MLYVIPTPIGNLEDISLRASRILSEVDFILVEDTRISGKLLKHLNISTKMVAFHAHNEHHQLQKVLEELQSGANIGLISDAGSPGISDPGFLLIRACREAEIEVTCLPGPNAVTTAVITSGIPCDKFFFEGFLPHKKGRRTRLEFLSDLQETFVLFESPHRLLKCLKELNQYCGIDRKAAVCRELTKLYEEVKYGHLESLYTYFKEEGKCKGEIVIIIDGKRGLKSTEKTKKSLTPKG